MASKTDTQRAVTEARKLDRNMIHAACDAMFEDDFVWEDWSDVVSPNASPEFRRAWKQEVWKIEQSFA